MDLEEASASYAVPGMESVPPGYKRTEVGVIPEDWSTSTIGASMRLTNGCAFKPSDWTDRGLPIIRIQNLNDPECSFNYFSGVVDEKYLVEPGDLLFAWSGTTGTSFGARVWSGPAGILNQHIFKVAPDFTKLTERYAFLVLKKIQELVEKQAHGFKASFVHVKKTDLIDVCLPLPPTRAEQQAIAEALTDANALIEALQQLIAKKRQIKQGTMQQLLTGTKRLPGFCPGTRLSGDAGNGEEPTEWDWETKTFGEIFKFLPTATNSRGDLTDNGDAYYIHYGDIHTRFHNHLDFSTTQPPRIDQTQCQNAALLRNGDWVMADASEDYDGVGKAVEIQGLDQVDNVVAGLHTFAMREKYPTFSPGFKGHLGSLKALHEQYLRVATGMKVFGVSKTALKDLELPVPKPEEQTAIATVLSDMDTEIAALEARLDKARQIKQGMMQELLTGKTRLI